LREAFNGSLSSLISGWTQLEISLGSILRVKDIELEVPREVSTIEVPIDWPSQGAIEFSHMTAQYKYVLRTKPFFVIVNKQKFWSSTKKYLSETVAWSENRYLRAYWEV
jgi:hypothetical protein